MSQRLREAWAARALPWPGGALGLGLALALGAASLAGLLAFAGPLITVAALAAAVAALVALGSLEAGLWGAIGIITVLPFASLPVKIVFTPTFLDLALGAVVLVYLVQWMTGRRRSLAVTPAHAPLLAFIVLAVVSFVAGMRNGPLTSNLLRQFAELLLNVVLVFVVVDFVDRPARLKRLALLLILGGTAAALIGLALYVIPAELANQVLSALRVLGYPAGDVLRYIEDNPENAQRAISTSIDPNFLGGMLAMIGGLLAPQLLLRRPLVGSRLLAMAAFGAVGLCLLLTYSRAAMAGFVLALGGVAGLRYRRLVWVMLAAALVLAVLPVTGAYVERLIAGLRGEDLATQMRLGEYKDAFILISRYPWLGVGFAGAPEIDIYLGVSSAYLLMAEQMGLVGLAVFLLAVAVVLGWAWVSRRSVWAGPADQTAIWLGLHAGLVAALVVGVVDHYFFRLNFQSAGTLFWLFVGLALAATRLARQNQPA